MTARQVATAFPPGGAVGVLVSASGGPHAVSFRTAVITNAPTGIATASRKNTEILLGLDFVTGVTVYDCNPVWDGNPV